MDPQFRRNVQSAPADETTVAIFIGVIVVIAAAFASGLWLAVTAITALLRYLHN
jgi:hypothetical protein